MSAIVETARRVHAVGGLLMSSSARVAACAAGGEVLISDEVHTLWAVSPGTPRADALG